MVERPKRSTRGSQESGGKKRKKRRARRRGGRGNKRSRPRKKTPKPKKKATKPRPQHKKVMEIKKKLEDRKTKPKTNQKVNTKKAAGGSSRGTSGKGTGEGKKKKEVERKKSLAKASKAAKKAARPPVPSRRRTSSRRPTKPSRRNNKTKAPRQKTKGSPRAGEAKVTQKKEESGRERAKKPHGKTGPKVIQKEKESHRERTQGKVKQEKNKEQKESPKASSREAKVTEKKEEGGDERAKEPQGKTEPKVIQKESHRERTRGPVKQEENKEQKTNEPRVDVEEGKGDTKASAATDVDTNEFLRVLKTVTLGETDAEKKTKHVTAQHKKGTSGRKNGKVIFEKALEGMAQGRKRVQSDLLAFSVAQNALASEETSSEVLEGTALVQQGLQVVKEGEQQLKDWLEPGNTASKQSKLQDKGFGLKGQSGGTNSDVGGKGLAGTDSLVSRAMTSMNTVHGPGLGEKEANKENNKDGENVKKIPAGGGEEGTGALGKLREGLNKIKEGLNLQEDGQKTKSGGKQDKAKVQQGLAEMKEGVGDVEEGLNVVMVGKKEVEEGVRDIGDSTEKETPEGDLSASEASEEDLKKYLEGWGMNGVRQFPISAGGNPFIDPTPTKHVMFPRGKEGIVSTSPKPAQRTLFYPSYLQVPQAGTVPTPSARDAPKQGGKALPVTKPAGGKSVGDKSQAKGGATTPTSRSGDELLKEIKELQHEVVELEAKKTGKGKSKKSRRRGRNV
ncbi:PREDICTED: ABC transporter F family member 4-like [Branchiostoma belcheri]|uniref:ABC transporter F family member 4-like n=1 Tax=Branchiostoma belcheri TaxID=7741 RepID=A0A6P4YRT8_BRABE|nr:PREDICTED: ABC transporter F family member 4-like [Branchiostoma belcheri]